ncbi:hypothetical protein F5Y14DRAFT_441199 [Nemania sp. NC0429]|nr:hypothetical protein F5Y14DRAFT_441199 [Nemania sp. NC0429]
MARPPTPKARGRQPYDDDEDDDEDSEKERLRGRLRSRSRVTWGVPSRATSRAKSRVKSRPTSRDSESSTDSIVLATPTRSSYVPMRSAPTAPSPGRSSGSSTDDSDDESSGSTQDGRAKTRTLKERMNGTPDSEPAPNPPSRSRSRHKSQERLIPEIESPTDDSEDELVSRHPRIIVRRSSQSRPRQAQQSRSRSRAPRPQRRSSNRHSEEHTSPPPKRRACVVCGDRKSTKKLAKLKCGHRWCNACLERRFKVSIEDPQNMPPKCCTSDIIPLKHVDDLLTNEFKRTWNEKFAKFSARGRNYCPRSKCREWIRPEDVRHHSNGRTSATCRRCDTEICGLCYNKWHESRHCPTDPGTAQFLKVAEQAGWKRCFNCQAMVELKEGCNHMTCRCGAQFCMICGSKWKVCECPWFSCHLEEEDELDHVQIPVPMVSRERLGGTDGLPRSLRPSLGYAPEPRLHRGHRDEDRAPRLPYADQDDDDDDEDDDEDDDDYLDAMADMTGMGNATGHFTNDDYRRRPHGTVVPPAPSAPSAPMVASSVTLERHKSGTNYVSGVNKARGVRGPSMERLADRFSDQRQNFKPNVRQFGHIPAHTAPPLGMGPLPPHQPPMVPNPISRRHTMGDDLYDMQFSPPYAPHSIPRRATTHTYMDDFAVHPPLGRHRYRQMEPPRPSELAGLTGPGSGMNRVFEWMNHVDTYSPDNQTVA